MTRIRGAAAFRRSLTDRLKTESKLRGRPFEHLRREFYLQRFLARIFSQPEGRRLLKGGASLLVRLPDARYSQDIDLLHTAAGLKEAVEDLRAAADLSELDPLRFVIRDEPAAMTGGVDGAKLKVDVYYDALHLFTFPIDLATELVAVGDVDYQSPRPIVVMEDLAAMPEFALYPLPAQIADKVCAMYGKYGWNGGPSSRYHDLVDLVLIISAWRFAADVLAPVILVAAVSILARGGGSWSADALLGLGVLLTFCGGVTAMVASGTHSRWTRYRGHANVQRVRRYSPTSCTLWIGGWAALLILFSVQFSFSFREMLLIWGWGVWFVLWVPAMPLLLFATFTPSRARPKFPSQLTAPVWAQVYTTLDRESSRISSAIGKRTSNH